MSAHRLAYRYAKSLLDLAIIRNKLDLLNDDVRMLQAAMDSNRDFVLMLKSPIIKPDKKQKILNLVFGGRLDEIMMAFIEIVVRKKRERFLPEITRAFIEMYNLKNHITPARITTAVELDSEISGALEDLMRSRFGLTTIELSREVNEDIIGGFILQFEDKLFDTSVRSRLNSLVRDFKSNTYIKNF